MNENDLVVLRGALGNRNFEGRINQDVRNNYLASPPLCVAYALAGRNGHRPAQRPDRVDGDGNEVHLADIWPSSDEIKATIEEAVRQDMFESSYADVFTGDDRWRDLDTPEGDRYTWPDSTYVRKPSSFDGMDPEPAAIEPITGARVLRRPRRQRHDRPHLPGRRDQEGLARRPLADRQRVEPRDFNSYGSRRGNHEVMIRGTFANVRLRNKLVEREGGFTRHFPDGEETTIYEAAMAYADEGVPLVVLAGKEYGSGSSRDWAAKGTALLGSAPSSPRASSASTAPT